MPSSWSSSCSKNCCPLWFVLGHSNYTQFHQIEWTLLRVHEQQRMLEESWRETRIIHGSWCASGTSPWVTDMRKYPNIVCVHICFILTAVLYIEHDVYLYVCLSTYLSIYLSIYYGFYGNSIYIYLSIYLSIYLFVCLSLFLFQSVYISLYICLSLYL